MPTKPIIYAHRGASAVCPENTMAAFKKAVEMGATGIECDVHMSKDGVLVICHDESLNRTTNGKGLIKDHTLMELRRLDAGGWMDKKFAGEKIPMLDELLQLAKEAGIMVNIELKNSIVEYPGMEERVIATIKGYEMGNKVIVSSFNHDSIHRFKQTAPHLKAAIVYMEPLYKVCEYIQKVGCDCVHPYYYALNPMTALEMKARGYTINVFTVDNPEQAQKAAGMGVHGIITNYPDKILKALESV